MTNNLYARLLLFFLFVIGLFSVQAQVIDSQRSEIPRLKKKFFQRSLVKASIVPTLFIGYGASVINNNGLLISSYDVRDYLQRNFKSLNTDIDDYLVYLPYAELLALNLFKYKCKNDFLNTSLLILKSELIMVALVYPLKSITHIERPNHADFKSFPSGHTAEAFVAASIIHKEYKHKSHWPGIAAYTVATSVGFFRMLNNAHWWSDVWAGAGIGILSVHLAYLTHKNKYKWDWKGRPRGCRSFMPIYREGALGMRYVMSF